MKIKRVSVRVMSLGVIVCDPNAGQTWDDVWLSCKRKRFALTLISKTDVEQDLKRQDESRREINRWAWDASDRARQEEWHDKRILELESILAQLRQKRVYIETGEPDDGMTCIYTAAELINRQEADLMLRRFMKQVGFKKVRFNWPRPDPRYGSIPM